MTMVTLIKKTLHWGGLLTFSEVQPIITGAWSIQADVVQGACYTLQATGSRMALWVVS